MHRFKLKGRELFCESVPVSKIAKQVGTPCYIYSINTFLDHFFKLQQAFKSVKPLICFSMKANSNLTVLKALVKNGSGLDIVSGGELFKAKKVGVAPEKIVFASVGKKQEEIEEAVRSGILMFNVETVDELDAINAVAAKLKRKQKVYREGRRGRVGLVGLSREYQVGRVQQKHQKPLRRMRSPS